jgi:KDO2-lipid IV(A) lauroyltransferase
VFVTAHYGGWEIGSVTTQNSAKPIVIHSVREREIDPESNEFLEGMLNGLGGAQYHIHYANEDAALGVLLLEALRKGEFVALQADRPATDGQTIDLELFGRPVKLPVGPAALARLADVPMVPVFTPRLGRRQYRVMVGEPIVVPRTKDRDADFKQAMQDLLLRIEDVIRQDPHQWFCLRDLRAEPTR